MGGQVAWIGLGNMGRGIVKNLVTKAPLSQPLIIYNRTQSRADSLAATLPKPVTVAPSIPDAVTPATIIFICLGDDPAVEETLATAVQTTNISGKLFVDCSTVHPDCTRRAAKLLESHGGSFVACPVFGAAAMAEAGQLVCVLAGKPELIERVKPFCAGVMGRANIDLSALPASRAVGVVDDGSDPAADPGRATMLKIVGNALVVHMVEAVAEGMVLAEKSGLGVEALHDLMELLFPGPYVGYASRMRSGDYYKREEPLFAVDLARKDASHMMDMAGKVGARLRGVELADEYLKVVREHQGERGDIAGIYGAVREEAGLKFEN
ncbi:hypothetical protein FQN52_009489 [Onygenales sp. PD_12]|nr:hypothetical protein FQN52_009489 [Onygenales sp. PD_12]